YNYETTSGLDADGARRMLEKFNAKKASSGVYQCGRWIPREHLLLLIDTYGRDTLKQNLAELESERGIESSVGADLKWFAFTGDDNRRMRYIVSLGKGKVYETNEDALVLLDMLSSDTSIHSLAERFPMFKEIAA